MTSTNTGPHSSEQNLSDPDAPSSTRTWRYDPAQPAPPPCSGEAGSEPPHYPGSGGPPPVARDSQPTPRRGRTIASTAAIALVAAVIGGGVGGYIDHQSAGPSTFAVGTLQQPTLSGTQASAGPISQVAQRVLPSVVQLSGVAGEGSGVVLSADGLILTNAHVLQAARGEG